MGQAFRDHMDYAFDVVMEGPPRKRTLRSSGLPYCPVLDVVMPRENEQWDVKGSLYVSMGTAAHTVLQAYVTLGDVGRRVWGCWKCTRCQHEWKVPCFRPTCPNGCNDAPLYVEVSYHIGMSGHTDLVVKYPHGWVVIDFKTTGREPNGPSRIHQLQLRTYCEMLWRKYRIRASYALVYLGRENLQRWPFGPYDSRRSAQQTSDWTNRAIRGFRAATQARKKPSASNLVEVARLRPCNDSASHDEYIGRKYQFSKSRCPMLNNCKKSDVHVAKMMRGILEGE